MFVNSNWNILILASGHGTRTSTLYEILDLPLEYTIMIFDALWRQACRIMTRLWKYRVSRQCQSPVLVTWVKKQLELQYIHLEVKPALQQVVNQFDNNFKKYKN